MCYAYSDGPQSTVSSPLLSNITNTYPVGPFAKYLLREVLSVVYSHGACGFAKHPKQEKIAENGSVFG